MRFFVYFRLSIFDFSLPRKVLQLLNGGIFSPLAPTISQGLQRSCLFASCHLTSDTLNHIFLDCRQEISILIVYGEREKCEVGQASNMGNVRQ